MRLCDQPAIWCPSGHLRPTVSNASCTVLFRNPCPPHRKMKEVTSQLLQSTACWILLTTPRHLTHSPQCHAVSTCEGWLTRPGHRGHRVNRPEPPEPPSLCGWVTAAPPAQRQQYTAACGQRRHPSHCRSFPCRENGRQRSVPFCDLQVLLQELGKMAW